MSVCEISSSNLVSACLLVHRVHVFAFSFLEIIERNDIDDHPPNQKNKKKKSEMELLARFDFVASI